MYLGWVDPTTSTLFFGFFFFRREHGRGSAYCHFGHAHRVKLYNRKHAEERDAHAATTGSDCSRRCWRLIFSFKYLMKNIYKRYGNFDHDKILFVKTYDYITLPRYLIIIMIKIHEYRRWLIVCCVHISYFNSKLHIRELRWTCIGKIF